MNVLLVDNLIMPQEGSLARLDVHPHLGLLALAAVAEAGGHNVEIFDPKRLIRSGQLPYDSTLYERVAADLLSKRVDVVGFTTLGCSFLFALGVAAILKRREPGMPVLLGGPHATMLHRQILERFEQVDIVVRHEADEIFPAVLDELEGRRFDHIPGISWRGSDARSRLRSTDGKPKVENLDSLPFVSYDHYPVPQLGLDLLRIEAGRGCPFNCTFCSTASFFQRSFRLKSAERLVRELDMLHERYGFVDFKLDHDMFTVNRRKVREFCEAVEGRGYRWRASARVDCVDVELLTTMAASGCVGLYFGIETGSARMQKICQKRLDLELVGPILDASIRLGIETTASFITGYPEEAAQDQDDTLDMLGRCFRRSCLPQLHMLAPEPGTPMFDRLGATIEYDGYSGRYNAELVGSEDETLVRGHPDIFQTYYFYPAEMPRARYVFAVETVDVLRRLGPIVVTYLLRAYGGRLSRLVGDLRRFAESRGLGDRPDAAMVEAYVRGKFGPRHHATSLVRFALRANGVGQGPGVRREDPHPAFDAGLPYRLSPDVHVLTDLHDCGALLRRIEGDPARRDLLDESETGERGVYLLRVSGGGPATYRIEPGVESILDIFAEEPRTCTEVSGWLREAAGLEDLNQTFFEDLVRAGILEPAEA
ncbi:MAG: RiPP biosynthesis radical SAM protein ApyD [Actinomycetota bacterium]